MGSLVVVEKVIGCLLLALFFRFVGVIDRNRLIRSYRITNTRIFDFCLPRAGVVSNYTIVIIVRYDRRRCLR